MSRDQRRRAAMLFAWLFLAAVITASIVFLPWRAILAALTHANKAYLFLALGVSLLATPLLASQWRLFIPPRYGVSWAGAFQIAALTVTARSFLPFFAGDASAGAFLMSRGGLELGPALLVLALDQLFTGLGKVTLVVATLLFAGLPGVLRAAGASLVGLVGLFLLLMVTLAMLGPRLGRLTQAWPDWTSRLIQSLADHSGPLLILRHPKRATLGLVFELMRKAVEVLVTMIVLRGMGIAISPVQALTVVTALGLSAVIPGPPAELGVFEATMVLTLGLFGVPAGPAIAAAVLQHALYLTSDFAYGYAVMLVEILKGRPKTSLARAPD